jgi:serralysin
LNGGLGADALNGGAGLDTFVFASALGAGNIDAITGFNASDDVIHLSSAVFGVAAGTLAASAFVIGAAAADADDRIIYDSATGALYFDADGNGGGGAVQFAQLAAALALTNDDFFGVP